MPGGRNHCCSPPRPHGLVLAISVLLMAVGLPAEALGAAQEGVSAEGPGKKPTTALVLSMLVPGGGQAYNGKWLKALIVAGGEVAFLERLAYEYRMVSRFRSKVECARLWGNTADANRYESKLRHHKSHRTDFIWWTSLYVVLSMVDAYVDAHLAGFNVSLQAPAEGEGAVGISLQVAW